VATILMIFLRINCPNFSGLVWGATPNFQLIWRPPCHTASGDTDHEMVGSGHRKWTRGDLWLVAFRTNMQGLVADYRHCRGTIPPGPPQRLLIYHKTYLLTSSFPPFWNSLTGASLWLTLEELS